MTFISHHLVCQYPLQECICGAVSLQKGSLDSEPISEVQSQVRAPDMSGRAAPEGESNGSPSVSVSTGTAYCKYCRRHIRTRSGVFINHRLAEEYCLGSGEDSFPVREDG